MIRKIFLFLLFFLIAIYSSSKMVLYACVDGNYICDAGGNLDYCDGNDWIDARDCYYGCENNACKSAPPSGCTHGDRKCENSKQYNCNNGTWNLELNCTNGCFDGDTCKCMGTCVSGGATCPCGSANGSCQGDDTCCTTCSVTSTPTPTTVVCESNADGDNMCNLGSSYCGNACLQPDGYWAWVKCSTNEACYFNNNFCYDSGGFNYDVGPIYCPPAGAPTPTTYCHPLFCYNIPPLNSVCPGFNPDGVCPSGLGNCDNCGGSDCGLCPGSAPPGGGPTPTPGCTENCMSDPRWPITCYNQTFGICGNTSWCYGNLPNNCGCAANLCSSQTCVGSCGDNCTGLLNCAPTTLDRFEIRRNDGFWSFTDGRSPGRDITDAQNRLQICDSFLSDESPNPRSVVYVAWLNNTNGCGDIDANSVKMKWLGNNAEIAMTKLASYQSGPCAYTATVIYPTDTNIPSAQGFQITMNSITGGVITDWTTVTPDLKLKVWNCQVPVSGTLYDGSSGQVCPDGGFTTPGNELGFSSLVFDSSSDDITATVTSPSSYGGVNLIWGKTYLPFINGGDVGNIDGNLLATGRVTRITDLGAGTAAQCPNSQFTIGSGLNAVISPYSVSPQAQIDFSFIRDQEAWYQVVGAGVKSRTLLQYGVPVTAISDGYLTLGDSVNDNGLVSGTSLLNINGNSNEVFGFPNNWWINQNTNNLDIYNYNYFYNNFYVKAGVGEILTDWNNAEPNKIYFVNGNLNITGDSPAVNLNTQTMMIIVSGNITIQPGVTNLDGIYIADGSITAVGDNSVPLTINGMLYAGGNVGLYRSFTDKIDNNTAPAVKVNYSPGLIFNLPPEIMKVLSGWREE